MDARDVSNAMARLFGELVDGVATPKFAYMLNTGDVGLLKSLDKLSAADASHAVNGGATIAAHGQHLRYGLSLMNRWAAEGGDPFSDAKWDEAWKTSVVNDAEWREIRDGLRHETERWSAALKTPRDYSKAELLNMISSIAHLAYHLGAIRQISKDTRGPREGTFA